MSNRYLKIKHCCELMLNSCIFADVPTKPPTKPPKEPCPLWWQYSAINRKCYKAYDNKLTFDEAKKFCNAKNGQIALANSENTSDFLAKLTIKRAWVIGYQSWRWSDGSKWDYKNLMNLRPSTYSILEECPRYFGIWIDHKELKTNNNVKSWIECRNICRNESDCRSWVWHHQTYVLKCLLLKKSSRIKWEQNTISGTKECVGDYLVINLGGVGKLDYGYSFQGLTSHYNNSLAESYKFPYICQSGKKKFSRL